MQAPNSVLLLVTTLLQPKHKYDLPPLGKGGFKMPQDAGQPGFEEVRPAFNRQGLNELTTFSHAIRPEIHGVWTEDFSDLSPEQIAYVTPELFESTLLRTTQAENAVRYHNPEDNKVYWVALKPLEYSQIAGNIDVLGNRVVSTVFEGRVERSDPNDKRAAATRGGIHAVEDRLQALTTYAAGALASEKGLLSWMKMSTDHPEYKMKSLAAIIVELNSFEGLLNEMVDVMGQADNWTPQKTAGVKKVVKYKLFVDRTDNAQFEQFTGFETVAEKYHGFRKALYTDKIARAKKYVKDHTIPATA
jgi:hypothetical protein